MVGCSIELVYGGGKVGLMGVLADQMLALGGHVIGVIPESLMSLEVAHEGLADLRVVESMHARKALMADLSDGFVALPGGLGTLEELFEVITWRQLGLHGKPIGVLNAGGFFEPLLALLDHTVSERFVLPEQRDMLLVHDRPDLLLHAMTSFRSPASGVQWINRDQR
jgi:uncharacterized protein (TIGR00730 family)